MGKQNVSIRKYQVISVTLIILSIVLAQNACTKMFDAHVATSGTSSITQPPNQNCDSADAKCLECAQDPTCLVADRNSNPPFIWNWNASGEYDQTHSKFLYPISGLLSNRHGDLTALTDAFDLMGNDGLPQNRYVVTNPVGVATTLKQMSITLNTQTPGNLDIHQLGIDVCIRIFKLDQLKGLNVTDPTVKRKLSWDKCDGTNPTADFNDPACWKAIFGKDALVGGIVGLCMNFGKNVPLISGTDNNEELKDNAVTIDFPGQGLLVPPNSVVLCSTQGGATGTEATSDMVLKTGGTLADFRCDLTFGRLDTAASSAPVYQSVRTPYFDEMFRPDYETVNFQDSQNNTISLEKIKDGNVSRMAPYQLPSNLNTQVNIDGVWVYNATKGQDHQICFNRKKSDGTVVKTCTAPPPFKLGNQTCVQGIDQNDPTGCVNGTVLEGWTQMWTSHQFFHTVDGVWNPGDQLSASCELSSPLVRNPLRNDDCAFFFMATVPYSLQGNTKQYAPLTLTQTILPQDAITYCDLKSSIPPGDSVSQFFHSNDPNCSVNTVPWVSAARVDGCLEQTVKQNRCEFLLGIDPDLLDDPQVKCPSN